MSVSNNNQTYHLSINEDLLMSHSLSIDPNDIKEEFESLILSCRECLHVFFVLGSIDESCVVGCRSSTIPNACTNMCLRPTLKYIYRRVFLYALLSL